MALSKIYHKSKIDLAQSNSLLGKSNGFNIQICPNDFWNGDMGEYWCLNDVYGFNGIMLEDLSLNFQTNWGDAGGAVLANKIASYVNSKFIKILAGQSQQGFQPFICSDAWTQQKVNGDAQPVKIQLKFKAYNDDRMGCTNYNDILRFLIHICSPIKSSNYTNNPNQRGLGHDIGRTLRNAAYGGGEIIDTVVEGGKQFICGINNDMTKEEKSKFATGVAKLVETADNITEKIITSTGNGKNNGNFTVLFSLGEKIHSRTLDVEQTYYIDWIITNFSFKPSRQFQMVTENGIPMPKPLWMDFDVSLETRLALSNKYVYNILMKNELEYR